MALYQRRKVILALLEKLGGSATAKSMQKYLFLFTRQPGGAPIYDFLPHRYGCFSFVANNDIHAMAHQGYLSIDEKPNQESRYTLTHDLGIFNQLDIFQQQAVNEVVEKFGSLSQDDLIAFTYRRWPVTAINSIIKERLLTPDELAKVTEMKQRYSNNERQLMTLGYEGISIEKYINLLIAHGVTVLCDVRKNAFSQKYGFSMATLQMACDAVGIQYIHIPQLGIESAKRQALNTQEDYDRLFDEYERTTLSQNTQALLTIRDLVEKHNCVCLLCFERDPRQCHRTRVAKAVVALPDVNFSYIPIYV